MPKHKHDKKPARKTKAYWKQAHREVTRELALVSSERDAAQASVGTLNALVGERDANLADLTAQKADLYRLAESQREALEDISRSVDERERIVRQEFGVMATTVEQLVAHRDILKEIIAEQCRVRPTKARAYDQLKDIQKALRTARDFKPVTFTKVPEVQS